MARHGYVNYNRRHKKKNNIRFFVISAVTIVVVYVVITQLRSGSEPGSSEPVVSTPTKVVSKIQEPSEPDLRVVETPKTPRAVVKPDMSGTVKPKPQLPVASVTEEVVSEAAKQTSEPAKPVKTAEDLLAQEIQKATNMARGGKVIESRDMLYSLMLRNPDSPQRLKIKSLLSDLSDQWLFSDKVLAGDDNCSYYKVQSGDLLSKIGAKHVVPWEFLLRINKILRPESLRAGQKIKVVNGPFNAVISRSTFVMDLYLNDTYVKSYKVGLGTTKHETPTGLWAVGQDKLVAPSWTDPDTHRTYDATDPDYPLGKRWVGLKGVGGNALGRTGFALHGTNEPQSIGQRRSRGCIRLADEDILEVYDLMTPGKSHVQIVD